MARRVARKFTKPLPSSHRDLTIFYSVVLAIEKRKKQDDELHAFKSYFEFPNAEQVLGKALNPSNPKKVYIRQAARATSAAPGFFREADVNGNVYMDGALMHNNPSLWAWNEAWRKCKFPNALSVFFDSSCSLDRHLHTHHYPCVHFGPMLVYLDPCGRYTPTFTMNNTHLFPRTGGTDTGELKYMSYKLDTLIVSHQP